MQEPNFYQRVYDVVRRIPAGRVTSYGAIAAYLEKANAARAVGYAMRASGTVFPPIPAHRVLNRQGILTARDQFAQQNLMQMMLESEGVQVVNHQVVDFEKVFWDPVIELSDNQ